MQLGPLGRDRKPTLLELDLTQPLIEPEPDEPLAKLRMRGKPRLHAVLRALHEAKDDASVAGLVAKVGATDMSLARAQELRAAVRDFASSGKPTVAWSESFGESTNGTVGYFLATGFDEVWLQSSGELNLLGIAAEVTFLGGLLDKARVQPQFGQRYEYKNAADRLQRTGFTDAHRESADRLAESAWEQIVDAIAAARRLPAAQVREVADRAPLLGAEALTAGLVDRLGYRDEVYRDLRRRTGDVQLLFADRWSAQKSLPRRVTTALRNRSAGRVALVELHGAIVVGRSRRTILGPSTGSDPVTAALRAAIRDDKVRAIVFRVDSPGGSAVASDTIWREVGCARDAGKPVVVSMGGLAGSGGYYVSCGADAIVAEPGTLTGSIGVFGGKLDTTGLTDWLGIGYDATPRGAHARMFSTHRGFDDGERARLEEWLDWIYSDFTGKVAAGRGMSKEDVHELARGRVWTGADALERGLVDVLGGLRTATEIARERAGLAADAPLRPAVSVPPLARLQAPKSSDDPRVSMSMAGDWTGWGSFATLAASLGLPATGPLTMPGIRLR
jgi:protease-4